MTFILTFSRRRQVRKKSNRIGPLPPHTTDGYDSTDHRTRHPASRQSSKRFKGGRSQRGRPFTQQSFIGGGGGRDSRGVAYDTQQELAWLDTGGGGVQLMRFKPLVPPAPPTHTLPPHPSVPQHVVQVQPRPQEVQPHPQEVQPRPQEVQSLAQEKLPTLHPLQTPSFSQKQLETYFKVKQQISEWKLDFNVRHQPFCVPSGLVATGLQFCNLFSPPLDFPTQTQASFPGSHALPAYTLN